MANTKEGKEMDRGLLDISVALSTRNITAGDQFALFVLVKNPFDKPVWIHRVHVSLPSELKLAGAKKIQKSRDEVEEFERVRKRQEAERRKLEEKIDKLKGSFVDILEHLKSRKDFKPEDGESTLETIKDKINSLEEKLFEFDRANRANVHVEHGSIGKLKIVSNHANVHLEGEKESPVAIRDLSIYDPESFREEHAQARTIELESSLPANAALQPGSTVVYTAVLCVEKSLIFTPSQYRLQFNVNYCFYSTAKLEAQSVDAEEKVIFTNTVAHELSIRPSVYSVLTGSMIGGAIGAIAKLLHTPMDRLTTFSLIDGVGFFVTVIISVILSGISIIFMARKSDAQSFVSVEDFWGGILIGFLVGYTGTAFFEQLTGIENPTIVNPIPKTSPSLVP